MTELRRHLRPAGRPFGPFSGETISAAGDRQSRAASHTIDSIMSENPTVWSVSQAKARFAEVIDQALEQGPQTITRNGRPAAARRLGQRLDCRLIGGSVRAVVRRRAQRTPPRECPATPHLPIRQHRRCSVRPERSRAGELRGAPEAVGIPIGAYDLLIAVQGPRWRTTLVTANVAEFTRAVGLVWQHWRDRLIRTFRCHQAGMPDEGTGAPPDVTYSKW